MSVALLLHAFMKLPLFLFSLWHANHFACKSFCLVCANQCILIHFNVWFWYFVRFNTDSNSLRSNKGQFHIIRDGCQPTCVCVGGPLYLQVVLIIVGVEKAEWISLRFVSAVKFSTLCVQIKFTHYKVLPTYPLLPLICVMAHLLIPLSFEFPFTLSRSIPFISPLSVCPAVSLSISPFLSFSCLFSPFLQSSILFCLSSVILSSITCSLALGR